MVHIEARTWHSRQPGCVAICVTISGIFYEPLRTRRTGLRGRVLVKLVAFAKIPFNGLRDDHYGNSSLALKIAAHVSPLDGHDQ